MGEPLPDELPCGTASADLLAWISDGTTPPDPAHTAACPHCQGAIEQLRLLWARLERVAALPVRLRPGLFDDVMVRLRGLLVTGWLVLDSGSIGTTVVSEGVLSVVAGRAARRVEGIVSVRSSRTEQTATNGLQVEIAVVADADQQLTTLADRLRRAVHDELTANGDITVTTIDVAITDLEP